MIHCTFCRKPVVSYGALFSHLTVRHHVSWPDLVTHIFAHRSPFA